MTKMDLLAASALTLIVATPALAQTGGTTSAQSTAPTNGPGQEAPSTQTQGAEQTVGIQDIIVTAQRQSQRLQDVPIAISAFTADNLQKQQIVNPLALQQSLPNVTFTKTNFTSSSFTIRGIGDLCVGATCDTATGIHVNDMPLVTTRLFESEFFDLERVEVLRGPQGTLFGRNATSGVVNFITAKPDLSAIHSAGEFEYGNYNSKQAKGMINLPLTSTIGIRVAGEYLKRDGYTYNQYYNDRVDGRDLYSVRGTLSWEPSSSTRVDLIGYYFHERDNRSRIQKQLCHRDPTGVLGCLPDTLRYEEPNANSTLASTLTSSQFFAINKIPGGGALGLQNLYGPDAYAGVVNPADVRTVNIDHDPTYFADEQQYTAKIFHDFGKVRFNFTGGFTRNTVDSTTDYNLAVENPLATNAGLLLLNAYARPGAPLAFLNGVRQALIPNGTGSVCQSTTDPNGLGVYGGNSIGCFAQSVDTDRSSQTNQQYSAEAHIDSAFDGPFNFLLGGIYLNSLSKNTNYTVSAFGLDYASGILGSATAAGSAVAGNPLPAGTNYFLASPNSENNDARFRLSSYGVFGETYYTFTDKLKLTLGLRYNHDSKDDQARQFVLNNLTPIGTTGTIPGPAYTFSQVSFGRLTGRAVLDYKITPNNLVYASYSRGYKSGGINPPLLPIFNVPATFAPETVNSYEIGSKNTFAGGALRLNLTGFYYQYKQLQLSRIIARTSVNDNVDANIYGVEAEAIVSPIPPLVINMNASYLHTQVASDKFLINPRDPSGGRSDAVIIKDITNGSNCVVVPNVAGNAALSNGYVAAVNAGINQSAGTTGTAAALTGPVTIPGVGATGAFGICSVLQANAAAAGVTEADGVGVNIRGNRLPQAPMYKFAVGAQYTIPAFGGTIVPRADLNYTGNFYASIFNQNIDRIQGYAVVNAQVQLNLRDDRIYVRGFVQNLTNNNAITGQYQADQSSGSFTNIFTLEPRRYGAAVGFKF